MCGIAGFISSKLPPDSINLMLKTLTHRGPDALQFWNEDNCTLGHTRLSIIDLSTSANQPMISSCQRYVIIYNGEVYNFKEIAEQLLKEKPGFKFRTRSDTEVILEAFAHWGVKMVEKLNGMFAIAIYDRTTKNLYLFRDRVGIKPIYYYHNNDVFIFASELKAITAIPQIKKNLNIDLTAIHHYLNLGYIPSPFSVWKEIKKFPQAHYAIFANNELKFFKYWDLEKIEKRIIADETEALEELKTLLTSSVRYRMISDVPYGVFLSGGIDSSLVTAVAQNLTNQAISTFTIGFKESKYNEAHYAKKISDYLGTKHHEFIVSEKDVIDLIPEIIDIYDEPFADDSALPTLLVSQLARQHVTMTLAGDGGDELFWGYGAYKWAKRFENPIKKTTLSVLSKTLAPFNKRFERISWLFDFDSEKNIPSHIFSQEQYYFSLNEIKNYFIFNFTPEIRQWFTLPNRKVTLQENQSLFDLFYYLPDMLLVKVDRASMKYALETRVPLLDYRIVEFAYNLRPDLKIKNNIQKYLLKKLLFSFLPQEFFNRPKWGFSLPLPLWMRNELKDFVQAYLFSEKLRELLNVDIQKIPAYNKWHKGNDLYFNRIWQLTILGLFCEKNL